MAFILGEAGRETVGAALGEGAVINAVNYAEVLSRLGERGDEPVDAHQRLERQGLTGDLLVATPLLGEDAVTIVRLRQATRAQGLSLGDRAGPATALCLGRPALTADRSWASVDVGASIRLIRP